MFSVCVCGLFVPFFHAIHTEQLATDTQIIQADTELLGNVALATETMHACPFQFFMKNVYE